MVKMIDLFLSIIIYNHSENNEELTIIIFIAIQYTFTLRK